MEAVILAGSRLVNRNITAGSGRTSMRLEPEVWDALREICIREGLELRELIKDVEKTAAPGGRTSAVRVHVLQYFRTAATDEGHVKAGHGTKTVTGGPIRLPNEIRADDFDAVTPATEQPLEAARVDAVKLDPSQIDTIQPQQLDA